MFTKLICFIMCKLRHPFDLKAQYLIMKTDYYLNERMAAKYEGWTEFGQKPRSRVHVHVDDFKRKVKSFLDRLILKFEPKFVDVTDAAIYAHWKDVLSLTGNELHVEHIYIADENLCIARISYDGIYFSTIEMSMDIKKEG